MRDYLRFKLGNKLSLIIRRSLSDDRQLRHSSDQGGMALLEVIIASIIIGITVLGVSLMLVRGTAFTASQGTNQTVLYLAEQKLERLRVLGFAGTPALAPTSTGANDGCAGNTEPCYNETDVRAGAVTGAQLQQFTRVTCVDYVPDSGPPYPSACPGPSPGTPPGWCTDTPSCTKRIRVTVTPVNQAFVAGADPITLEMILINPPQANL